MTGLLSRLTDTHSRRVARSGWWQAATLADLGRLTAGWLEGSVLEHPSYHGRPDEETGPITRTLARANRAGFVTLSSQPGEKDVPGYGGALWSQRAAVEGFADADVMHRLWMLAVPAGVLMTIGRARRRMDYSATTPVTAAAEQVHTSFGAVLSRREVAFQFEGSGAAAVDAAVKAWQVTLVDLDWGRNDVLWPMLDRFAEQAPS